MKIPILFDSPKQVNLDQLIHAFVQIGKRNIMFVSSKFVQFPLFFLVHERFCKCGHESSKKIKSWRTPHLGLLVYHPTYKTLKDHSFSLYRQFFLDDIIEVKSSRVNLLCYIFLQLTRSARLCLRNDIFYPSRGTIVARCEQNPFQSTTFKYLHELPINKHR